MSKVKKNLEDAYKNLSEYYNSQEIQDWMNAPMGKPGVGQVDTIVIKPCPFCGGEAKISGLQYSGKALVVTGKNYNSWNISCINYCARFIKLATKQDAIEVWNKRAL